MSETYHTVSSSSVADLAGVQPIDFMVPNQQLIKGKPEMLTQDRQGYLVPDPEVVYWLLKDGEENGRKPLAVTRQSREILRAVIEHQESRHLTGIHADERYLVIEGLGGIGKSHTLQWFFGRMGIPVICEKVPSKEDLAVSLLFGNPNALNKTPGNIVETAKAFYKGRGLKNPTTLNFMKEHPRELYLALYPGDDGWYNSEPEAYKAFWTKVADLEGIDQGQKTVPQMGLFELAYRNGLVLFLDELNRLKEGVRDNCMRAFESGKTLETNTGVVLQSEKHPATLVVGAMNGARKYFNVKPMDPAQRRRAHIRTIPSLDANDYRDFLEFLITGSAGRSANTDIKWDKNDGANPIAPGATCKPEFLRIPSMVESKEKNKTEKVYQKDRALRDLAEFHVFMEAQINQILAGEALAKGITPELNEHIPTGTVLIKAFVDRVYQTTTCRRDTEDPNRSIGMYATIQAMGQAFKEVYVQPLIDRGIPEEKIAEIINFGPYGNQDASGKVMNKASLGHIASMFGPMISKDIEGLNMKKDDADKTTKSHSLLQPYLETNGFYPAIDKKHGPVVVQYTQRPDGKPHLGTAQDQEILKAYPLLDTPNKQQTMDKFRSVTINYKNKPQVTF